LRLEEKTIQMKLESLRDKKIQTQIFIEINK